MTQHSIYDDKIKIGVILPLTGPLTEYGESFRNGMTMAIEELGDKGEEFVLIFEDSQYNPTQAINAFSKLTNVDNVDLLLDWGSPTGEAIAPLVKYKKTPIVLASVNSEIASKSDYIIRLFNEPSDYGIKTWEYLRSLGIKKIGVIKTQNSFLDLMHTALEKNKLGNEEVILIDTFDWENSDFRTTISKIKQSDVEIVAVLLGSGQIAQFYKQSVEMDLNIPTFGSDFFESLSEVENAQGTMEGVWFPTVAESEEFLQKYIERFSSKSQISNAARGYDIMNILAKEVDFESSETVMSSLRNINDFEGSLGTYDLIDKGNDRYFGFPIRIRTIQNGEIVTLVR